MKAESESWTDFAANWAAYLGYAFVRWMCLFLGGFPLPYEGGVGGWLKESVVLFALIVTTAVVLAATHTH